MTNLSGKLLNLLSRESTSGRLLPEIDGLRFIAIFTVILFHLNGFLIVKTGREGEYSLLIEILNLGEFGVQLFFVISGFIIAFPFADKHMAGQQPQSLQSYYLRRITRLEPTYVINLLALFFLIHWVKGIPMTEILPNLLASIFYVHNVAYCDMSRINPVAWSLELELQFYLLAPFIAYIFRISSKIVRRFIFITIIILASFAGFYVSHIPHFPITILSYGSYFIAGFLLTDIFIASWKQSPRKSHVWDAISLLSWLIICTCLCLLNESKFFLSPLVVLAYCGAFCGTWFNGFLRIRWIYTIGGMCYTIYLYHYQIISFLGTFMSSIAGFHYASLRTLSHSTILVGASIVSLPVIILVSGVLFVLAEKPFMRRRWYGCFAFLFRTRQVNVVNVVDNKVK